jgi:lipoprotein-anchoring transpeptidase ErfK/SrfK
VKFARRTALIVLAAALVVGFGAAAYVLVPWNDETPADAAPAPEPRPVVGDGTYQLVAFPPDGATGIAPETNINVTALNGRITRLGVQAPDGTEVPGYLDPEGGWWMTKAGLAPGTTYEGSARVVPTKGKARVERWSFTTIVPTALMGARVVPGDNEVVGVGQPISLRFTEPVANRSKVEERLKVTTSKPVEGSWRWMSDREIHWRPRDYWPANTEVFFDGNLMGVDAGNGVFGNAHRTAHFRIGDSHVSIADSNTHTLTVYENGNVIKQFPMSLGKPEFPTMSGKHIVLGKQQKVIMDSRTNGIPLSDPEGYLTTVYWDVQISTTGEYVHAAPWSVSDQGRRNVSHGCINLSTENATWFFNWSQRGDVVEVLNTTKPPNNDQAIVDWKIPYEEWVRGSALYNPIPPPQAHRV